MLWWFSKPTPCIMLILVHCRPCMAAHVMHYCFRWSTHVIHDGGTGPVPLDIVGYVSTPLPRVLTYASTPLYITCSLWTKNAT